MQELVQLFLIGVFLAVAALSAIPVKALQIPLKQSEKQFIDSGLNKAKEDLKTLVKNVKKYRDAEKKRLRE